MSPLKAEDVLVPVRIGHAAIHRPAFEWSNSAHHQVAGRRSCNAPPLPTRTCNVGLDFRHRSRTEANEGPEQRLPVALAARASRTLSFSGRRKLRKS